MRGAMVRHDEITEAAVIAEGGTVVRPRGEGDSRFAVFSRATAAIRAAAAVVAGLADEPWRTPRRIEIRVAAHTGEADLRDGDYYGSAVNRCARLRSIAHPSQILLTQATAELVDESLPQTWRLDDRGTHRLKDLARPERVFQLVVPGLPHDFPPLRSLDVAPHDLPAAQAVPLPAFASSDAPFVGRDVDLAWLQQRFEVAAAGECRAVVIAGEPGIGKSRLAAAFATSARDAGATVLYGRCDRDGPPYHPWSEALGSYISACVDQGAEDRLGRAAAELGRIVPSLAHFLPADPASSDPDGDRVRLFDAVAALLRELASHAPLVVVIDDVQWADHAAIQLLRHLLGGRAPAPILLVATVRDDAANALLTGPLARTTAPVERLNLGGIDEAAVAELVAPAGGGTEVARELRERTQGNPFFLLQLLESSRRPDGGTAAIPDQIRGLVLRQLQELSELTTTLLQHASVVGTEFRVEVVEHLLDLDEDSLLDALDEAVAAGVLREVPGASETFMFVHALVREAIYEGLSSVRRGRLHCRVGGAIEACCGHRIDQYLGALARHYGPASGYREPAKAAAYATRAAETAAVQLAYEDSRELAELALHATEAGAPADRGARCDALMGLGVALWQLGDVRAARDTYRRAAEEARGSGDAERFARAALGATGAEFRPFSSSSGRVDTALVALLEQALAAEEDVPAVLRAKVLAALAQEVSTSGRHDTSMEYAQRAVSAARNTADPRALALALAAQSGALWFPGHVSERRRTAADLLEVARNLDDRHLAARALMFDAVALLDAGELLSADRAFDDLREFMVPLRDRYLEWILAGYVAGRATRTGDLASAGDLADNAFSVATAAGADDAPIAYGAQLFALRREQGRLRELEDAVVRFADEYPHIPAWRAGLALLYAESGRADAAAATAATLLRNGLCEVPRDYLWATTLALLSETCAGLGDGEAACALYGLLEPFKTEALVTGQGTAFWGLVEHHLGILAATMGRHDEARTSLEAAVRRHAGGGAVAYELRSLLALAQVDVATGDHQAAAARRADVARRAGEKHLTGLHNEALALPLEVDPALAERYPSSK